MSFFSSLNFNIVTVILVGVFLIPILTGIFTPFSNYKIQKSFGALIHIFELIISLILAIYLTRYILADTNFLLKIYQYFPSAETLIYANGFFVNIFLVLLLMLIVEFLLRIITIPIYRYLIIPLSNWLSAAVNSMNFIVKRIVGGLWNLPKSVCIVFIVSLLLGFYVNYFNSSTTLSEAMDQSSAYQFMDENITGPLLNTDIATQIPVILSDSFQSTSEEPSSSDAENTLVVKYFNGMTLDEAVESNNEIDSTAMEIVGSVTDDKEKAHLLYQWICSNITYDNEKAELLASTSDVSSGAIVTFQTKTGVCFDYSCLYVAMCRAVDVKVRFITGLGYSGTYWGDHAWNQIYDSAEDRWINVDTTFGSSGLNYFDRSNFDADHKDSVIQKEWDPSS